MKKAIIVGSTGVIGKEILKIFRQDYQVVEVNRSSGDFKVDMQDAEAVEQMFQAIGGFDVLIAASGYGKWGTLEEHSIQDFHDGLNSKLMGQVNLVVIGRKYANEGAVFILTSGVLAHQPMIGGLSLAMINAALESFVKGAALELEQGMKINAVSPSFAKETMELMGLDSSTGVPAIEFAKIYKKIIDERKTGQVYQA
ncbi:short chain dehydrogenase [Aureibacter tunicatorum]|uniref:NAD(P)-dependent dehydrogenase (Short-subunit alcohol dehydrogenase family) n=1 Tax=Aureibacter tunicatorum TaxID=866807 RepID=A0AAE4BTG4_9BACT|nr:short chain dehydrogenase [Aureibacter tunicatorum]MDR6240761.1 NAD(P)-dependent dehydrogenase (short-subunit alcohol dehydrogenase family) [Aureibacter tunicatorum]BDD06906.1 short chain dehydrogenase [Aureibacter tunicatorum]